MERRRIKRLPVIDERHARRHRQPRRPAGRARPGARRAASPGRRRRRHPRAGSGRTGKGELGAAGRADDHGRGRRRRAQRRHLRRARTRGACGSPPRTFRGSRGSRIAWSGSSRFPGPSSMPRAKIRQRLIHPRVNPGPTRRGESHASVGVLRSLTSDAVVRAMNRPSEPSPFDGTRTLGYFSA